MNGVPDSTSRVITDTGPWVQIPVWVLNEDISPAAVRLYATLRSFADERGMCWPSRRTLATRLHVSVDTVDRALKDLVRIDAVAVEKQFTKAGDPAPNFYVVYSTLPHMRGRSRVDAATGDRVDAARGSRVDAAQNYIQHELDPEELDPSSGAEPDLLTMRLVKVCSGPRVKVWPEAPQVVSLAREHFSDHVIDEAIGVCELLATPPTFPRYLLKVLQERAPGTGQHIPDLFEAFKEPA